MLTMQVLHRSEANGNRKIPSAKALGTTPLARSLRWPQESIRTNNGSNLM